MNAASRPGPGPIALPPLSGAVARAIGRSRARIEQALLRIDEIDPLRWRIVGADGAELLYFPHEDRWRRDQRWGRGTLTLIAELRARVGGDHGCERA